MLVLFYGFTFVFYIIFQGSEYLKPIILEWFISKHDLFTGRAFICEFLVLDTKCQRHKNKSVYIFD